MSDQSLRERIAVGLFDDGIRATDPAWLQVSDAVRESFLTIADVMIAQTLEWLSANGLAIVPVEITEDMADEMECQFSSEDQWAVALKAAPPAADLLKGKNDEQG